MRERSAVIILSVFYITGIIGHALDNSRQLMILFTPYILLAGGLFVIYLSVKASRQSFFVLFLTLGFTFLLEAFGVNTGMLFGRYKYGSALGVQLLSVPVIISLNWLLVILGTVKIKELLFSFRRPRIRGKLSGYALSGILAVLFDLLMEPVAIKLGYWRWESGGLPPFQNYISWFVISAVCSFLIERVEFKNSIPAWYFLIQLLFFGILIVII